MDREAFPLSDGSTTVGRLLSRVERAQRTLDTLQQSLHASLTLLEEAVAAPADDDEEVSRLAEALASALTDRIQAVSGEARADGGVAVKTAAWSTRLEEGSTALDAQTVAAEADIEQLGSESAETSARLDATRAEMEGLRIQLETAKKQAGVMVSELSQARMAALQAEALRLEAAAACEREADERVTTENELQRVKLLLEEARREADALRNKLAVKGSAITEIDLRSEKAPGQPPEGTQSALTPPRDPNAAGSLRRRLASIVRG
jgi:chromosome segregation ATPase